MAAVEELPNDVEALKRLLLEEREQRQAAIDEAVKAAVAAILRRYYGPRSESFDPRQLFLFGQQVVDSPLDAASVEEESGEPLKTRRPRHKHGRQQLPAHLERIEIEHDLDDKACPACGSERYRIGQEVSEQLEYFPASFKVLRHVRHKYACAKCDHDGYNPNIESAKKPPQPIDKGLPGPSLLAYVITSKLGDHLPLYRLERIFERQQVHLARSTMCAWMRCAGELVKPLVEMMTVRVRQSRVIHTDDTVVPIQSPGAKQCRKGRIWCYLGDEANPYAVYDYTRSRSRDGPAKWLAGYEGYLQADGGLTLSVVCVFRSENAGLCPVGKDRFDHPRRSTQASLPYRRCSTSVLKTPRRTKPHSFHSPTIPLPERSRRWGSGTKTRPRPRSVYDRRRRLIGE